MAFEISEIDVGKNWDELFACEWAAWMNPRQSIWELTYPVLGSGPSAEAEAIKSGAARQLKDIKADSLCRWMKAADTNNGKRVAGALWEFYDSNPYRAPSKDSDVTWLPEGGLKDLCDSMHTQNRAWRPKIMPVAHAHLINLFTLPDLSRPKY